MTPADVTADPDAVVRDFNDAISHHDFDRLAELLDDSATYEVCGIELEGAGFLPRDVRVKVCHESREEPL